MDKKLKENSAGKLYGIGVGPGDPELLTLKAYRILQEVDIITAPCSKKGSSSLALEIVQKELDCQDRVVELLFPMTQAGRCGQPEEIVVRDLTSLTGRKIDYLSMIIIRKRKLSLS